MLNIQNISKSFGGVMALHEVSFRIAEGSFVGLIGPNGSGKTTMFNVISGALKPTRGKVVYEGETISGLTPNAICHAGIARTFQIPQPIKSLTVAENVIAGGFVRPGRQTQISRRAHQKRRDRNAGFRGPESGPGLLSGEDDRRGPAQAGDGPGPGHPAQVFSWPTKF